MEFFCFLLAMLIFSSGGVSPVWAEQQVDSFGQNLTVAASTLDDDMEQRVERQLKEHMGDKIPEDVEIDVELQVDDSEKNELEGTTDRREDFYQEVEYMLSEYDQELAIMHGEIVKLGTTAGNELKKDVAELQSLRLRAGEELKKLKEAEGPLWDELKIQMEAIMEHLDRAYGKAIAHFQEEEGQEGTQEAQ